MKWLLVFLFALCAGLAYSQEVTFRWKLPAVADVEKLKAEMFPGSDAVILEKEQGYTEEAHTKSAVLLMNDVTVTTRAVIVKLFNENAVKEFGSYSYELPDYRLKEEQHVFKVKARVMKPDGSVWVLPESDISKVAGVSTGRGRSLTQKVMFKLPNLAPGDIVQIEYVHAKPFSYQRQVLFFYHDRYPVLSSTVDVIMTKEEHVNFVNFPASVFPPVQVEDLGKAISSAWTLKNLPAVPTEPYGRPFADVSYLTTVVNPVVEPDSNGWRPVAKSYYKYNLDDGSVSKSFVKDLGLDPSLENPDWASVDRLYTSLRKYFRLKGKNEPYTDFKKIDQQIDDKEGDASDVAFIMKLILDRWKVPTTPVLLRDRRMGEFELAVPSIVWFDRLALIVSLNNKVMLYDFDRCIPSKYEVPWYLTPTTAFAVSDTGGWHLQVHFPSAWREHISSESHLVTLHPGQRPSDSVTYVLQGAVAEEKRAEMYSKSGDDLSKYVRLYVEANALQEADHSSINSFLDDPVITITGVGHSRAVSSSIDSFVTFRPKNHLLRQFREEFSAAERHYDIYLRQPFAFFISWFISIPENHTIAHLPDESQINGPPGVTAQIVYLRRDNVLEVKADILFNTTTVPLAKYAEWRSFLDNVNAAMEREVVFRKP